MGLLSKLQNQVKNKPIGRSFANPVGSLDFLQQIEALNMAAMSAVGSEAKEKIKQDYMALRQGMPQAQWQIYSQNLMSQGGVMSEERKQIEKEINGAIGIINSDQNDSVKNRAISFLKSVKAGKHGKNAKQYYNVLQAETDRKDLQKTRDQNQEGGQMAMPPELMQQEAPVDTYPNMTPEEEAMPVASDEQMQEDYVDYVTTEVLTTDEQNYLNTALDNDPQLEGILDKVITYAAEFTGEGNVEGPGTGISDSIPARLSDGEFVITEKATDQIGADNLQTMMDEAERAADGGMMQKYALGGAVDNPMLGGAVKDTTPLMDEKTGMYGTTRQDDEMKKQMMYANRMPSIIGR